MKLKKSFLVLSLCLAPLALNSCGETNNSVSKPTESEFETKTKEIYKKAVEAGFTGTYEEWLDSIAGDPGKDGKEIKEIKYTNSSDGFANYLVIFNDGTTTDLKIPVNGPQGPAGQDGKPGADGEDGKPGIDGQDGSSVLSGSDDPQNSFGNIGDLYINLTTWDVFKKENSGWIKQGNIKGADGQNGQDGKPGNDGEVGQNGQNGQNGTDGKSAYEIYREAHPEYTKSEAEWLDDLVNGRLGTKQKHTITFNTGCDVVVPSQQVEHGEKIEEPETPIREYYTFDHWEYKGQTWSFIGYTCTEDMQLDAVWKANEFRFTATIEHDNDAWHVGDPDRKIIINLEDGDNAEVEKLYNKGLIKIDTFHPDLISINKFTLKALAPGYGNVIVTIGDSSVAIPFSVYEQPLTISKAIELHKKDLELSLEERPTFNAFGKVVSINNKDIILYDGADFIATHSEAWPRDLAVGDTVELCFTKLQSNHDYYRYKADVVIKSHKQIDTSNFRYSSLDHYQCHDMNVDGRNGIIGKPKLLSLNNIIVDRFDTSSMMCLCNYQYNSLLLPINSINANEVYDLGKDGSILNIKCLAYDYRSESVAKGTVITLLEKPTIVGNANDVTCSLTLPEGVTASKTSNLKYGEEVTIYYKGQETLCLNFDNITLYKQFNSGEYTIRIKQLGENRIYFRK